MSGAFGNPPQPLSIAGRDLPRCQPNPCGKVTTPGETAHHGAKACTASAVTSPTPGIVVSRRNSSFSLTSMRICLSSSSSCAFNSSTRSNSTAVVETNQLRKRLGALGERLPELLDVGNPSGRDQTELRQVTRIALTVCVRWRTSSPRVRYTIERAWARSVFTATNRIVGR